MKEQKEAMRIEAETLDLSGSWRFCIGSYETAVFTDETVFLPGSMDENGKGTPV